MGSVLCRRHGRRGHQTEQPCALLTTMLLATLSPRGAASGGEANCVCDPTPCSTRRGSGGSRVLMQEAVPVHSDTAMGAAVNHSQLVDFFSIGRMSRHALANCAGFRPLPTRYRCLSSNASKSTHSGLWALSSACTTRVKLSFAPGRVLVCTANTAGEWRASFACTIRVQVLTELVAVVVRSSVRSKKPCRPLQMGVRRSDGPVMSEGASSPSAGLEDCSSCSFCKIATSA